MITAIDPGCSESGFVVWEDQPAKIHEFGIIPNAELLGRLRKQPVVTPLPVNCLAIEMVASYGMPVGKEVFETVLWIGRFHEAAERHGVTVRLVYRLDVKRHHCNDSRAKDANIRQSLIDKYGPPGKKASQGLTYGLKAHLWAAFAVATFVSETAIHQLNVSDK